jgi:hypothetical protein
VLEPPRVTVVDPRSGASVTQGEELPEDVVGDDGPRSRRGLYAAALVLAALGLWRGTDAVLDQRAADAEERRLQAVVELVATTDGGGNDARSAADVATVTRSVGIRNDGPRPVEVLSASFGSLRFDGELEVEPDRLRRFSLSATAACDRQPPEEVEPRAMTVRVRTQSGAEVEQELPFGDGSLLLDAGALRRACGYLEVQEAGFLFATGISGRGPDARIVSFDVANLGRFPLLLAELRAAPGMRLRPLTLGGEPVSLPVELPAAEAGVFESRPLVAELTVIDCAAAVRPDTSLPAYDQQSAAGYSYRFARPADPAAEDGVVEAVVEDLFGIAELVDEVCP